MLKLVIGLLFTFSMTNVLGQYTQATPVVGKAGCKSLIKKHIVYPEKDLANKVEGTVVIIFETNKAGEVLNAEITESVSSGIDSAAIALFNIILWNPATYDGKPVNGTSDFEIKYQIKNYNKVCKRRGYQYVEYPFTPIDSSGYIYGISKLSTQPEAILEDKYSSIYNYIYDNLQYPEAAAKLALEGDVELMFIIETSGITSNMVTTKHLGGGCTEEALRIIEPLKWKPGLLEGKAVRTRYKLNITFKKGNNKDGYIPNQQGSGI